VLATDLIERSDQRLLWCANERTHLGTRTHERAFESCDALLHEYVSWNVDELAANYQVLVSDEDIASIHANFQRQLPVLMSARGRIYVARVDAETAGVAILKPITDEVAELKRVFVRPVYRGLGIGRRLVERIIEDAASLGYVTVRLDSYRFMRDAHALYRSLGFVDTDEFENGEVAVLGAEDQRVFMSRELD
jgi:GNAT superfamily N-acetyltransferase